MIRSILLRSSAAALLAVLVGMVPWTARGFTYTYTFDKDYPSFGGNDGWFYSYCSDAWTTTLNGGVTPLTDDGCGITDACATNNNCGYDFVVGSNCSESDPADNHIQGGSILWKDYQFTARFRNDDNDTWGFVFRYRNTANFYLFLMSREYAPNPPCAQILVGSRLLRIVNGAPTLLGSSGLTYEMGKEHTVRITVNGSAIKVELDVNSDGIFADSETAISVTDGQPLPNGRVGFYAYDNGAAAGGGCGAGNCWFDDLKVDVWSLAEDKCQGISYEGVCQGNNLAYCFNGELYSQPCTGGCCRWYDNPGYFSCGYGADCAQCVNECTAGSSGCSKEATHAWTCGNVDGDPCTEKVLTACPATGTCDLATGKCACIPQCTGKVCGPDGCGGSCGTCPAGQQCGNSGTCSCAPNCAGKSCGSDGCGGSCGTCPAGTSCDAQGTCQPACVPSCIGKNCGPDGCGGSCGTCLGGQQCSLSGTCACVPSCTGKVCGDDGCGGTCGTCQPPTACVAGQCVCQPACAGKNCGPDGCGGSCGSCPAGQQCVNGICGCVPSCAGKLCGDDGCAGSCGTCQPPAVCLNGQCACLPDCLGKVCGDDGCGGTCGSCGANEVCLAGVCTCTPDCSGKQCGTDGCGGSCGTCTPPAECVKGTCLCLADCTGKQCGSDGCGGSCGTCGGSLKCVSGECLCVPACDAKFCGDNGCGGSCGTCPPDQTCSGGVCIPGPCQPACEGMLCGDDGCGGSCGICLQTEQCVMGDCLCMSQCAGKECGSDGCDGLCGKCKDGFNCQDGLCVEAPCVPACEGLECGDDGCGGICGTCQDDQVCQAGTCVNGPCEPKCAGKQCGPDACGGICGECDPGFQCNEVVGLCIDGGGCKPEAYRKCIGNDLYWFDSCDVQGPLSKACEVACVDDQCVDEVPPVDESAQPDSVSGDTLLKPDAGEPDTGGALVDDAYGSGAAGDAVVTLGGGKRTGGCSAGSPSHGTSLLLASALLCLGLFLRRRPVRG